LDQTRHLLVTEQRQARLIESEAKHRADQFQQSAEEAQERVAAQGLPFFF